MYRSGNRGGNRFGGGQRSFAPVKVGEELEVTIEAVGAKGDGIAKKNGFVLFIPGVKEGQTVKIRVTKVFRKVGFAEVVGEGSAPAEKTEESSEESAEESSEESEAESSEEQPQESEQESSEEDSEDFGEEQQ